MNSAPSRGLIIDSFAGGGGASTGIEWALGRSPDFAINHDAEALRMHAANHPITVHLQENVWKVDPASVTRGQPVFLLWASPDCRHHSKAKGGAPVSRAVRGLADVVILWAKVAKPQIICLENVEEFQDWGPLTEEGKPCVARKGSEFARWVRALEAEGYAVQWRQLRACDYGAPTIRKRLFVVARRDGHPILWPAPTHADPKKWPRDETGAPSPPRLDGGGGDGGKRLKPWRTAAEIIDWSIPCPSIFLTKAEAKRQSLNIIRPLADKTLARIARGMKRYVLDRAEPFMVAVAHGDSGGRREYPLDEPHGTVTSAGQDRAIVAPHLMTMRNSGKPFTAADEPCHTVTAGGAGLSVVAGFVAQHNGNGVIGREAGEPLSTVTTSAANQQPVAAFLAGVGGRMGQSGERPVEAPYHTVCTKPDTVIVLPHLTAYYGTGDGNPCDEPIRTATTHDRFGHVEAAGALPPLDGWRLARARQVAAFLLAQGVWEANADGSSEFVQIVAQGQTWIVWDIGMRMLTPRELARAQGFPDSYDLEARTPDGRKLTETAQRHKIGNSVCPDLACAIVTANAIEALALPAVKRRRAKLPPAPPPAPAPQFTFEDAA